MQPKNVSTTTKSMLTSDMKNEANQSSHSNKNQKNEYSEIQVMVHIHDSPPSSVEYPVNLFYAWSVCRMGRVK